MRVLVTAEAALKFVMGFSHMAIAAERNGFFDFRRMSVMTANATDILVLSSCCCQVSRRNFMTIKTDVV